MNLFDHMNLFGDVATNHRGDFDTFKNLFIDVQQAGAIPKIQLWNNDTFNRDWIDCLTGEKFVPSVFRPADVDFILPYRPLALKVASVESTHWELIKRCCQENLPLIVSTGGMDEDELGELLGIAGDHPGLCLMHCVSLYPTPRESINLGRLAR